MAQKGKERMRGSKGRQESGEKKGEGSAAVERKWAVAGSSRRRSKAKGMM